MDKRAEKIRTVHRKYIENTTLFEFTILNVFDKPTAKSRRDLEAQVLQIVQHPIRTRPRSSARLFLVAGGSYSGKDELLIALEQMERARVVAYVKATDRPKRSSDRGELRHFHQIPRAFDLTYEAQGHRYGVSRPQLWEHLYKGKICVVVVSDRGVIEKLQRTFGTLATTLYLHASLPRRLLKLRLSAEVRSESERKARLSAVLDLQNLYSSRLDLFDHVLLNTTEPEDLYDQAFNILDHYCGTA